MVAPSRATLVVALYVYRQWRMHQKKRATKPMTVSNRALKTLGVSHDAKNRALRELEHLGLLRADIPPRKPAVVVDVTGTG